MTPQPITGLPGAVLFACNLNRVRSPMAACLLRQRWGGQVFVDSCGLQASDGVDPFVVAVMAEIGLDLSGHAPKSFEVLEDGSFDLVISLSQEAHGRASEISRTRAVELEHWPTPDPTLETGSRDQRLRAYRIVRDGLDQRLAQRFPGAKLAPS